MVHPRVFSDDGRNLKVLTVVLLDLRRILVSAAHAARCIPTATCQIPTHESSQVRRAQRVRSVFLSYEGIEHPVTSGSVEVSVSDTGVGVAPEDPRRRSRSSVKWGGREEGGGHGPWADSLPEVHRTPRREDLGPDQVGL